MMSSRINVVTVGGETKAALEQIRLTFSSVVGRPQVCSWSFPGGDRDELPTWIVEDVEGSPLAVAVGSDRHWQTRAPFLVSRSPLSRLLTPTVEINIPVGSVNRAVAGYFYRVGGESRYVLAHRGTGMTVRIGRIGKDFIHKHFASWLVPVQDEDRTTYVIPAAPSERDIVMHLARFAEEVGKLKSSWSAGYKRGRRVKPQSRWRSQLTFPKTIARAVQANSQRFDYKHGPLQSALRAALDAHIRSGLVTMFNDRADLAVLNGKRVLGLFEVKTDLGPQLYAGLGQLFWYRQIFGSSSTPLFLVLPDGVRARAEVDAVGRELKRLGVTLLLGARTGFRRWDDRPLPYALRVAGLPVRQGGA